MEAGTVSITFWGDGLIKGKWLDWYDDVGGIFEQLGYKRTHIAIDCKSYANKKIVSVGRKEKTIIDILQSGESPKSISCFSLSKDYKVAMFDYNVMAVRQSKYLSIIMNRSDLERIDAENIISTFKQYIEFKSGEVYQMNREEVPLMYAANAKTIKPFESLIILKRF